MREPDFVIDDHQPHFAQQEQLDGQGDPVEPRDGPRGQPRPESIATLLTSDTSTISTPSPRPLPALAARRDPGT